MKLYLDTSVIGAMSDEEMPGRIRITRSLLDSMADGKHTGVISNIVLEEMDRCPEELKEKLLAQIQRIPLLVISEDENSAELLELYERENFVRKAARLDLRHLAVATVGGVDALVSWNFRDIVNIRTRRAVHAINLRLGYPLIEIVSPEEVIEYEE